MAVFLKVGQTSSSLSEIPAPTSFAYGLQDVSSPDAGRVQDANATMYKMRFTQKRKIAISWTNPTAAETATILQAFNPEYVYVYYLDALSGTYEVREFYVGDRNAMLRQVNVNGTTYSTISFNIIER